MRPSRVVLNHIKKCPVTLGPGGMVLMRLVLSTSATSFTSIFLYIYISVALVFWVSSLPLSFLFLFHLSLSRFLSFFRFPSLFFLALCALSLSPVHGRPKHMLAALALLNYWSSQMVSQTSRDVTEYKWFADRLESQSVREHFSMLRDLANIHIVPQENLESVINESSLAKVHWSVSLFLLTYFFPPLPTDG